MSLCKMYYVIIYIISLKKIIICKAHYLRIHPASIPTPNPSFHTSRE